MDLQRKVEQVAMKAVIQKRYGGTETLELREVPVPVPRKGEVLVRVRAAGIDRGTVHLMTGLPLVMRLVVGLRGPRQPIPGRDLAGTVEAVGEGVTRFAVGDAVYGTGHGSLAELTRAPQDRLAAKPASLSFEQAAAVPVSALTALQALRNAGRVAPGQRVLVIGASGGVGSYAVQLAKAFGAEVTGVCSTTKVDLVRSLGADHVVDYTRSDLAERAHEYDLVLDIAGNRPVRRLRRLLTPTGTLVIVGGEGGDRWTGGMQRQLGAVALSPFVRHRLAMLFSRENSADLVTLADLADRGAFRPAIDRTFDLDAAAKALHHLEAGHTRG
jgi:NADPH:quinone reductase-like Zn-dependent oxidoreductase